MRERRYTHDENGRYVSRVVGDYMETAILPTAEEEAMRIWGASITPNFVREIAGMPEAQYYKLWDDFFQYCKGRSWTATVENETQGFRL